MGIDGLNIDDDNFENLGAHDYLQMMDDEERKLFESALKDNSILDLMTNDLVPWVRTCFIFFENGLKLTIH